MENEIVCDLSRKGYKVIERKDLFRFGIDSVLLSWFAKQKKDDYVLDLGTGNGVIPILMEARNDGRKYVGVEILQESADLAKRNVELNGLDNKIQILNIDMKDYCKTISSKFDVVTTNPPYMKVGKVSKNGCISSVNDNKNLEVARHEVSINIEQVIKTASMCLKSKGKFYIVYKPDRLVSLFYYMRLYKIEPKIVQFVVPYAGKESNIVLVEGIKDGKESVKILENIVVYDEERKYTKQILDIYNN